MAPLPREDPWGWVSHFMEVYSHFFAFLGPIFDLVTTNDRYEGFLFTFSSEPMFPKKVLDLKGPYISMNQTSIRNVCPSRISDFCLLSFSVVVVLRRLLFVAHLQPTPAYVKA